MAESIDIRHGYKECIGFSSHEPDIFMLESYKVYILLVIVMVSFCIIFITICNI